MFCNFRWNMDIPKEFGVHLLEKYCIISVIKKTRWVPYLFLQWMEDNILKLTLNKTVTALLRYSWPGWYMPNLSWIPNIYTSQMVNLEGSCLTDSNPGHTHWSPPLLGLIYILHLVPVAKGVHWFAGSSGLLFWEVWDWSEKAWLSFTSGSWPFLMCSCSECWLQVSRN